MCASTAKSLQSKNSTVEKTVSNRLMIPNHVTHRDTGQTSKNLSAAVTQIFLPSNVHPRAARTPAAHAHVGEVALEISETPEQLRMRAHQQPDHTILDGGATVHIFGALFYFVRDTLRDCHIPIRIAKGTVFATKCGCVRFMNEGIYVCLEDVLYLPGLSNNLISESKFDLMGLAIYCYGGVRRVLDRESGTTFVIGRLHGGLYRVEVDETHAHVTQTYTKGLNTLDLMHFRMGHVNEDYIRRMVKVPRGTVLSHCDACARALSKKQPYRKTRVIPTQATKRLDLVNVDVLVKMDGYSIENYLHLGVVADAVTRKTWGLPLHTKGEMSSELIKWAKERKTETGRWPVHVRSDGGGEIDNNEFVLFCEEHGIKYTTTTLSGSNQNALAERSILAVEEGTRVSLIFAGMPAMFWKHAALHIINIHNLTPHSALGFDTPSNRWNEVKMDLKAQHAYIRVFGCLTYAHILDKNTGKLGERARPCVYLGVDDKKAGVLVWLLEERKLGVSRNNTYNETVFPFKTRVARTITTTTSRSTDTSVTNTNNTRQGVLRKSSRAWTPSEQSLRNLAQISEVDTWQQAMDSTYRSARTLDYVENDVIARALTLHDVTAYKDVPVPRNRREALASEYAAEWERAIQREMQALQQNNTWKEVEWKRGIIPLPCMWVFDVKHAGVVEEKIFKARLVVCGNNQVEGRDYTETFSAVALIKSFRIIMALATLFGLPAHQFDICNAYLNATLEEEVYMRYPAGYPGPPGKILRLVKSIYGLKQAGRLWGNYLAAILLQLGFRPLISDTRVYIHETEWSVVVVHVDDGNMVGELKCILDLKNRLSKVLRVKYLGELTLYIGLEVIRTPTHTYIHQSRYHQRLVKRYGLEKANPRPSPSDCSHRLSSDDCPVNEKEEREMKEVPYKSAVGALLYSALGTRPDITNSVVQCAQYSKNPGHLHWKAVKHCIRYVSGTHDHGICYSRADSTKAGEVILDCWADADWNGNKDTCKSTSGGLITLAGGPIVWLSRLQKSQALSSCEAEYIALCELMTECLWVIQFLYELRVKHNLPIPIHIDNQAAIALAHDPVHHQRSKHIDLRYKFMKEYVSRGVFSIMYVPTKENISDLLTKSVSLAVFRHLVGKLVRPIPKNSGAE